VCSCIVCNNFNIIACAMLPMSADLLAVEAEDTSIYSNVGNQLPYDTRVLLRTVENTWIQGGRTRVRYVARAVFCFMQFVTRRHKLAVML
jgi:hypothetical protein